MCSAHAQKDLATSHAASISVGMGEIASASSPTVLFSLGLGSCIGLVIYSPKEKIAAMAHIMLPEGSSKTDEAIKKPGKYADFAVEALINELKKLGVDTGSLKAKMAGGAKMFANSHSPIMAIGEKNAAKVIEMLEKHQIPLVSKDIGGNKGRSVRFYTDTCMLEIKAIGMRPKLI